MRRILLVLLFAVVSTPSIAANYVFDRWRSEPLAFSFSFNTDYLTLNPSQGEGMSDYLYGVRVELIEFMFPVLQAGLVANRFWSDHIGGGFSNGYQFELNVALLTPRINQFRLTTKISYQHLRLDAEDNAFDFRLHGGELEAQGHVYIAEFLRLYSGIAGVVNGGEMNAESTVRFTAKDNISLIYKAGLDILVDYDGHIGIESRFRERPSVEVYFQRSY